jgi:hypothetical protein
VRLVQPERVREVDDELPHRPGREQIVPAFGVTEPGQVDRDQVHVFGERGPGRRVREQALRPGAQQDGVRVAVLALGVADRQPVDGADPGSDRGVQRNGHGVIPPVVT